MSTPAEVVERRTICHECGTIWRLDPGEEMSYCDRCGSKQLSRETHFTVDQTLEAADGSEVVSKP